MSALLGGLAAYRCDYGDEFRIWAWSTKPTEIEMWTWINLAANLFMVRIWRIHGWWV